MARLTDDQIAQAVALSDTYGVNQAAGFYGIKIATLKRYSNRVSSQAHLNYLYLQYKKFFCERWSLEVGSTITCGASKLRQMIDDPDSDVARMTAIANVVKILGEVQVTALAVTNGNYNPIDQDEESDLN